MENLDFPRTINVFQWCQYLNRELTGQEQMLFHNVKMEKMMNMRLEQLSEKLKEKGLEISLLTELDGNCLFNSLSSLGIGNNSDELRKGISYLMTIFRDYKNFFPDQQETLQELFINFNEVELVHCKEDKHFYKYTYDIMCQDLNNSCNWTRLPTQLILMFISKLFNVNISVFHDNGFESNIFMGDKDAKVISLAQLSESHYLPVDKIGETPKELSYDTCKSTFIQWAQRQAIMKKIKEQQLEQEKQDKQNENINEEKKEVEFKEVEVNEEAIKNMSENNTE